MMRAALSEVRAAQGHGPDAGPAAGVSAGGTAAAESPAAAGAHSQDYMLDEDSTPR